MQFTAKEIAQKLGGTVEGDENVLIAKPCRIEDVDEHGITFLANTKYTHYIYERKAAAILIARDFQLEHPVDATLIRVDNPYLCVARVLHMVAPGAAASIAPRTSAATAMSASSLSSARKPG